MRYQGTTALISQPACAEEPCLAANFRTVVRLRIVQFGNLNAFNSGCDHIFDSELLTRQSQ
jgi:hypothetical protein